MEFFFWLYMLEIYLWLALLLLHVLASIIERFLVPYIYIYKQIKILLQRTSKNLKLAIIFKNYYFFFVIKLYYSIKKNILIYI